MKKNELKHRYDFSSLQNQNKKKDMAKVLLVVLQNNTLDYFHGHDRYKSDLITSEREMNFDLLTENY
jgi:hypothetical protein